MARWVREERAEGRCECTGHCGAVHDGGRCDAPDGEQIRRRVDAPWIWRRAAEVLDGAVAPPIRMDTLLVHPSLRTRP